jgi:hypothetical protein
MILKLQPIANSFLLSRSSPGLTAFYFFAQPAPSFNHLLVELRAKLFFLA